MPVRRSGEGAKVDPGDSLEIKKTRLRQATEEFESFFILQMLKAMRQTIPESGLTDQGLGKDVYTSLFDEELSRNIAGSSPSSIAEMLFRSLEKHLEAEITPEATGDQAEPETEKSGGIDTRITDDVRGYPAVKVRSGADERTGDPTAMLPSAESARPGLRMKADPILEKYGPVIDTAAKKFRVDARLVYSVIKAESGGDAEAVSSRGARGLMQLIDSTAAEMGVTDSLDVRQNIEGGTRYLRQLLDEYGGNVKLALAAYNAGPGTVSKYNGVPPYPETRQYIERVLGHLHSVKTR